MFQLKLTPRARREMDKLTTADLERISNALRRFSGDPRASGTVKLKRTIYRIRVGDWRVTYKVYDKDGWIVVGKIARRSEDTYDRVDDLFR